MLTVATANVNGVRAAVRRGMGAWLAGARPHVLCLQEVRAGDDDLTAALGGGWHVLHEESSVRGRAGVAVATRARPLAVRTGLAPPGRDAQGRDAEGRDAEGRDADRGGADPGAEAFDGRGRWAEADLDAGDAVLTVISAYVPTGEAGTRRQLAKEVFLGAAAHRLAALAAQGRHVLLTGDLNVAHREADIKNWRGNLRHSGFLPAERAWFDGLLGGGAFVDVVRSLCGDGPGPYSWWSWRGSAFDRDAGWRLDHQIASAGLAALAREARTDRAPSYAERWSDHAPVVVRFDLDVRRDAAGTRL